MSSRTAISGRVLMTCEYATPSAASASRIRRRHSGQREYCSLAPETMTWRTSDASLGPREDQAMTRGRGKGPKSLTEDRKRQAGGREETWRGCSVRSARRTSGEDAFSASTTKTSDGALSGLIACDGAAHGGALVAVLQGQGRRSEGISQFTRLGGRGSPGLAVPRRRPKSSRA